MTAITATDAALPLYLRRRAPLSPRRMMIVVLIGVLHVLALTALMLARKAPPQVEPAPIIVSMITTVAPPPEPSPPPPPQRRIIATPQTTAPAAIEVPVVEDVELPPPVEAPPVPAAPAPVIPPNFVAAYLNNPAPSYPAMSVRLREEGSVMLLVLVNAGGIADQVQVEQSSGYARLDDAAVDVVKRRWRFVPAKQGEQSVAAWVRIPLSFELKKH